MSTIFLTKHLLLTAEKKFWRYVESGEMFPARPRRPVGFLQSPSRLLWNRLS
jgi:hypothetical protein